MSFVEHETVEVVAEAIRESYVRNERPDRPAWKNTPEHRKVKWRRMAAAAIKAYDPEAEFND